MSASQSRARPARERLAGAVLRGRLRCLVLTRGGGVTTFVTGGKSHSPNSAAYSPRSVRLYVASNGAWAVPVTRVSNPFSTNSVKNEPSLVRRFGTRRRVRPLGGSGLRLTVRRTCHSKWLMGKIDMFTPE